jgi:5-(carboxyamino)imidazole ribonucleotide synthase
MSGGALMPGALDAQGRPVTLGVLGGGQLGRMFVHAAQAMGYATIVLDPDPTSPAGVASDHHIHADYLDEQGLAQLLQRSSAITTEFENVPAGALYTLGAHRRVAPGGDAVATCQHRAKEKRLIERAGVACAPYAVLESTADFARVADAWFPGILKTAQLGYDGKGQVGVPDRAALAGAWDSLKQVPCVFEKRLPLALELSVVLARDPFGEIVTWPVQQNVHHDGILAVTQSPGPDVTPALAQAACTAARQVAQTLEYVGVLCVEFFVLDDGSLVVNEMAPRPHNSGHHTIDSCDVSQFEGQVRVLAGLPLITPRQHSPAVMLNVLGDLWFDAEGRERAPDWAAVMRIPGAHVHLYAKASARRGRKMGHVTVTADSMDAAREAAHAVAQVLGVPVPWARP